MSDWSEVQRGWTVADKTGQHWTVTGRAGAEITISAPGKLSFTKAFTGEVTVISRPAPQVDPAVEEATAKGLIAVKFGGIEIGKQNKVKGKPSMWATPVEFLDPGTLLAHLRIFHGAMSDEPSLHLLVKEHAALHGPDEKTADLYEPHVHDPDYESR